MSSKFPTLEQALEIEQENKDKFEKLKLISFQQLRSIPETWIFSLFNKNEKEKFHEYVENITDVFTENILTFEDLSALEFFQFNILEILNEMHKIDKKLEVVFKKQPNKEITFEDFVNQMDFNDIIFDGDDPKNRLFHNFHRDVKKTKNIISIQLSTLYNSIISFKKFKDNFDSYLKIYINDSVKAVTTELESFRRIRNIADNAKTENIYDQAVVKHRGLENDYRWYFYWAIGLTVTISLGTFFVKKLLVPDLLGDVEFWVLKASIILVGITLITYFLKQSAHYQRLADQNYQTQVELQAYPSFMESIPTEEAASVRKELALKYFGREIDGTAHKDMSNLISDQMKSTTEMVKAATDVLKAKG